MLWLNLILLRRDKLVGELVHDLDKRLVQRLARHIAPMLADPPLEDVEELKLLLYSRTVSTSPEYNVPGLQKARLTPGALSDVRC